MPEPLRVVLMSYGAEGFADLRDPCVAAGHHPVAYVYAAPRRPGGQAASAAGAAIGSILAQLPPGPDLLLPRSLAGLARALAVVQPDLVVCNGFPWKLSAEVLRVPRLGVLNVHPSLLPRHRGPMPVHWAVRHGDPETGVTVHWMDESFDTGRILVQHGGVGLPGDLDGDSVFAQIQALSRELLSEALELAVSGCTGTVQSTEGASYEGMMGPQSAVIDWSASRHDIHNLVRTFRFGRFPVPGPLAVVDGRWVSVLNSRTEPGDGVRMECGDGPLWIVESVPVPSRDAWLSAS
ncbi:methionyl-tRNA formyltransferase [Kitasatospora sp. MAA4]|uniref:methionyl-tRNA formyltransferase n=1 Tax=Kitasatospora sp. MAA4 TaxID=3035093 RepID=UPI0024756174|nr:formyltransferase family protein [Kitasatospora sp. MAA4]MDH6131522.1 methionyl-tRNA formyltransferase [Kitasatospora sp. MAA4]